MVDIKSVRLKYTSPAVPPTDININVIYTLFKDTQGLYVTDGNIVVPMDIKKIKSYFTPIDCSWNDVFAEKKQEKSHKSK